MKGTIELRSKLTNGMGTWRIEIPTGRQPDGTYGRIRETFRGTKEQAELRKAEILLQLDKSQYIADSNTSFGELSKRWLKDVKNNQEPNTHRFYQNMLDSYILPEFKDMPISKIKPVAIKTLLDNLRQKKSIRGELFSVSTIQHVRATISACLQYAVDLELLSSNPCANVRLKRTSKTRKIKSSDVYDDSQVKAFLKAAQDEWYYMYFLLGVGTGMRQNEILALTWENVDFHKGRIAVERAIKQNTKEGIIVGDPKTATGTRNVAIDGGLIAALRQHKAKQNEQRLKMGSCYVDQGLVIASEVGKVVNSGQIRKVMKRVAEKAKVPYIPPKNLRHTHATLLLLAGINPKVVQERLGHSDISITLNVYSAMLPNMQKEAAKEFEGLLDEIL